MNNSTKPAIIVTDAPIFNGLTADGFRVLVYADRVNYIARLADDRAALLLIDGARDDWALWCSTPKSSPATRRIPIIVVADDLDAVTARGHGADVVIKPADLRSALPDLLRERARVMTDATSNALRDQCAEAPPPDVLEAVRLFNTGEYYAQHDLFEALWVAEDRPVRDLYRAVLQVGVAYYQVTRGNYRGAHKMLLRSVQWLDLLPDVCQQIDVAMLKADSAVVRAALDRVLAGEAASVDAALLKPVRLLTT